MSSSSQNGDSIRTKPNGVHSTVANAHSLDNDVVFLTQLLGSLEVSAGKSGEEITEEGADDGIEGEEITEEDLQELLQTLEQAHMLADGIEGRVDALLENLESVISGLDGDDGLFGDESQSYSTQAMATKDRPVETSPKEADSPSRTGETSAPDG